MFITSQELRSLNSGRSFKLRDLAALTGIQLREVREDEVGFGFGFDEEETTMISNIRDILAPGGTPVAVVNWEMEEAVSASGFEETWRYCYEKASSTREAISNFLDIIEEEEAGPVAKALSLYDV